MVNVAIIFLSIALVVALVVIVIVAVIAYQNSRPTGNPRGSSCRSQADCQSGDICSSNICRGGLNSDCNATTDCAAGLICDNRHCVPRNSDPVSSGTVPPLAPKKHVPWVTTEPTRLSKSTDVRTITPSSHSPKIVPTPKPAPPAPRPRTPQVFLSSLKYNPQVESSDREVNSAGPVSPVFEVLSDITTDDNPKHRSAPVQTFTHTAASQRPHTSESTLIEYIDACNYSDYQVFLTRSGQIQTKKITGPIAKQRDIQSHHRFKAVAASGGFLYCLSVDHKLYRMIDDFSAGTKWEFEECPMPIHIEYINAPANSEYLWVQGSNSGILYLHEGEELQEVRRESINNSIRRIYGNAVTQYLEIDNTTAKLNHVNDGQLVATISNVKDAIIDHKGGIVRIDTSSHHSKIRYINYQPYYL